MNLPSTKAQAEELRPQTHPDFERDYLAWYTRKHDTVGQPFDPTLLVEMAKQQWADMPHLAAAFARCTAHWYESDDHLYSHFYAPLHRALGKHAGCRLLQHPTWGRLVVDVHHDTEEPGGLAISGIEYLDRVMRSVMEETRELYWPAGDAVPTSSAPHQGRMRIVHVAPTAVGQRR